MQWLITPTVSRAGGGGQERVEAAVHATIDAVDPRQTQGRGVS